MFVGLNIVYNTSTTEPAFNISSPTSSISVTNDEITAQVVTIDDVATNDVTTLSLLENQTDLLKGNSTCEEADLSYLVRARYTTIALWIISFYLFGVVLVYGLRKKVRKEQRIIFFLLVGAAGTALSSCSLQLSELWRPAFACDIYKWIYGVNYVINNCFFFTIIWTHQHKLYIDARLSESKSKCLRTTNLVFITFIQITILGGAIGLVGSYTLCQTSYGCVLIWSDLTFSTVMVPITIISISASTLFRVGLLMLIVYPLSSRLKVGVQQKARMMIRCTHVDPLVKHMVTRLALCTFVALLTKIVIDVFAFLEAVRAIDVFVSNLRVMELILNSFSINFSFSNWKQRLFPFSKT